MTPLQLEILLHYHARATDYRDGDFSAPAVRDVIDWFAGDAGLLTGHTIPGFNRTYMLTERGRVFIEHVLREPLPVQRWEMPRHPVAVLEKGGG